MSKRHLNCHPTTVMAADEPLIGASGLASRSLIDDPALRPDTLAGCFEFVAGHCDVHELFRTDLAMARQQIERLTGADFAQLPSDPQLLRPRLAGIRLKKHKTAHKRWNAFGMLQSTLILTGWLSPLARMRYKLPTDWEDLLVIADKHGKRRALAPFFRDRHRRGLSLAETNGAALVDYVDCLARETLDPNPWKTAMLTQLAWNFMRTRHAAWPATEIRLPPLRISPFAARADLRPEPLVAAGVRANRTLIAEENERPAGLGACFDYVVRHPDVPQSFRTDTRGARAVLARVTGRDPADLPTDPVALRPILAAVRPIQFDISHKRWRNILALVRSTLVLCGWLSAEARKRDVLPAPWSDLLAAAEVRQKHHALPPFFRFCHRRGLTPDEVTQETLLSYLEWLTRWTLDPKPWQTVMWIYQAWRHMQRLGGAWPGTDITLPSRRVYHRRTDFPAEFYADLNAYLDSLKSPPARDFTYGEPLSPAAVRTVMYSFLRAATFRVNHGTPLSEITSIACLATPSAYQVILAAARAEAGGRWSVLSKHIAYNLVLAAKRWVKPGDDVLMDLEAQRDAVKVRRSIRRRRDLLAQFATPEDRSELYDLPARAFEEADRMLNQELRDPKKRRALERAAKLHETALALALLFTQPVRIKNLVALDVVKHFRHDRRGKLHRIFIEADEVKNATDIEILLPDPLIERIDRHVKVFLPILLRGCPSNALFPGRGGKPLRTHSLGPRLRRIVEQQLGARFTAHLARHLAVEQLLEKDVNNLPIAQRLLGHSRPETTEKIYGLVRTSTAQGAFARIVEENRLKSGTAKSRKIRRKS